MKSKQKTKTKEHSADLKFASELETRQRKMRDQVLHDEAELHMLQSAWHERVKTMCQDHDTHATMMESLVATFVISPLNESQLISSPGQSA